MKILAIGAVLALSIIAGACGDEPSTSTPSATLSAAEPSAPNWKTWVLSSPSAVAVPPPPRAGSAAATRDERNLRSATEARTAAQADLARKQDAQSVVEPWLSRAMALVSQREKNPPAASRAYGLVSVAMYDAAVASYHWMYRYDRKPPKGSILAEHKDPSYPSDSSAIAGAGSRVLAYLYPEVPRATFDLAADDAAQLRIAAGANYPSDVSAGLALGRAVGERVVTHAKRDGSDRKWDGRRPRGRGFWEPPPGSLARPTEPLAGTWRTWILRDGRQVRPGPPPDFDSAKMRAEALEVVRLKANLTAEHERIANFWAGGQGTPLPPGVWNQVMFDYVRRHKLTVPRQTRVFALMNVAMADAGVAAWDAKFKYWNLRPENVVRDLGLTKNWKPLLDTPFFPAYVSGHSTYSSAAGEVMAHLFPDDAKLWRAKGAEAGISRLYGGIHFRSDNVAGSRMGREIGRLTVRRAEQDGAEQ